MGIKLNLSLRPDPDGRFSHRPGSDVMVRQVAAIETNAAPISQQVTDGALYLWCLNVLAQISGHTTSPTSHKFDAHALTQRV